jgi:hypothetical protein
MWGKDISSASPQTTVGKRVPRLTMFALTTWSVTTCTCKYCPFDSSNGSWKINMIKHMVSTFSTLFEKNVCTDPTYTATGF